MARQRRTCRQVIRQALADGPLHITALRARVGAGYSANTIRNNLFTMNECGEIRRVELGVYELSPGWR